MGVQNLFKLCYCFNMNETIIESMENIKIRLITPADYQSAYELQNKYIDELTKAMKRFYL